MEGRAKPSVWIARFALIIIVACLSAVLACAVSNAVAEPAIDESRVSVGDDGQTYGVPYEGSDGLIVMPDMTRVRATNGNFGFISNAEMQSAILDYATSEEEKTQSIRNTASKRAPALASATSQYFGVDLVDASELEECSQLLYWENGLAHASAAYSEVTCAALAKAINEGMLEQDVALELIEASFQTQSSDVNANESGSNETALERATAVIDNRASQSVTASQVVVSQDMFNEIYEIAKNQLAVSIPVYASDGVTVVGEYMVGRM